MPDQHLLIERQRGESVGIQLHDRGFVDPLEQILAVGRTAAADSRAVAAGFALSVHGVFAASLSALMFPLISSSAHPYSDMHRQRRARSGRLALL